MGRLFDSFILKDFEHFQRATAKLKAYVAAVVRVRSGGADEEQAPVEDGTNGYGESPAKIKRKKNLSVVDRYTEVQSPRRECRDVRGKDK